MNNQLEYVIQTSASGIEHPYYSVSPATAVPENMYLRVCSYPPLDHVTTVSHEKTYVDFHVLLESEVTDAQWEIDLWHNSSDVSKWEALRLVSTQARAFCSLSRDEEPFSRKWYSGRLMRAPSSAVSFTIRFRIEGEPGWRWVRDQLSTGDGQLIYQSPSSALIEARDLSYYVDDLNMNLKIDEIPGETPDTTLWSVTTKVAPAESEKSGYSTHRFGLPSQFVRWFSLVRLWTPWLAPRQGKTLPLADKDAVLYSFLRKDGLHFVVLCISGLEDVLTVFRFEHDRIVIHARNDREVEGTARLVVAAGNTFGEANAAVMYHARSIVSRYSPISPEPESIVPQQRREGEDLHASWIQDWYDGFSFCTWNSLGQNLTEEKILGAIQSLEDVGVRITNLIIDDNWQSLDNEGKNQMVRGWTDFEANPKAFPQGLKSAVSNIRRKYPNIKHVCVWHALLGYWGGISPDGKIAQTYKTLQVQKSDSRAGERFTVVDAPDVKRMYDDFYAFLLSAGVDSVKTDAQFFLDKIDTAPARRSLTSTYLSTWMIAQLRYFSARAISCMSQSPQIIFSCQLPNNSPAIPLRNSDDFFPDVDASHPWHIFCNAHNAQLTQHLNVLPDWDMFQTQHKWASWHTASRCISGGPIYITDEPGKHNVDLITSMTATTCRGQTVILRPSVVGRSTEVYIGYEAERFCKIAAYNGSSDIGSSFLGVFNCQKNPITEVISLNDFIGIKKGKKYAVRHHHPPRDLLGVMDNAETNASVFGLSLPGHGWEVLSAIPIFGPYFVSEELKDITVANLGLLGKITGAAAIIRTEVSIHPSSAVVNSPQNHTIVSYISSDSPELDNTQSPYARLRIRTTIKALGTLGLFIPKIEEIDWKMRMLALIEGKPVPPEFAQKSEMDNGLLKLDVEGAWKYLNLESHWSNEVQVEVLLR